MRHLIRSNRFTEESKRHHWQADDLTNRILDFPAGWVKRYLPLKSRQGITFDGKNYRIGNVHNYGAIGTLDGVCYWVLQYECSYADLTRILHSLNQKARGLI